VAHELAERRVAPWGLALDPLPEGAQARQPLPHLVAGDDGRVHGADRGADHPIGLDAGFVQRMIDAALVGAQGAAALKDQYRLARQFGWLRGYFRRLMKDIIHGVSGPSRARFSIRGRS
jgi:hypothetical protein